jgi:2-oxoisovalerate dehydrogenase E1 component alpha subunit
MADMVRETQKQSEAIGTLQGGGQPSLGTMFEDVFEETPWHIRRQRQQLGV